MGPYFLLEPHLLGPWLGRGLALAQSTSKAMPGWGMHTKATQDGPFLF